MGKCSKEHTNRLAREWRKRNPHKHKLNKRKCDLKHKFGITLDEYNNMLAKQEHRCCICSCLQSECKRNFAVDHEVILEILLKH